MRLSVFWVREPLSCVNEVKQLLAPQLEIKSERARNVGRRGTTLRGKFDTLD